MSKFQFFTFLSFFVTIIINAQKIHEYELAPKDTTTNVYFNTTVNDPYQWMENPNDYRLQPWVESQKKITNRIKNRYLKTLDLKAQISAMYYGVRENEVKGFVKKDKKSKSKYQFEYKIRNTNRSPDLTYRVGEKNNYKTLVDIKKITRGKDDNVAITGYNVNEDYDLIAVSISYNGSDWDELLFYDLKNGQQLHDSLKNLRGGRIVWDEMNLFYVRYDEPKPGKGLLDHATGKKLYYHKFGASQDKDVLLFQNKYVSNNEFNFFELNDKLFFYSAFNHKDKLYKSLLVADKDSTVLHPKKFLVYPNSESVSVEIEEAFGDRVLLSTTWDAPNGRVLLVNLNEPNKPVEIVPEYDVVLRHVNRLGKDKFVCVYRNGNSDLALFFDLDGKLLKKIEFPEGKKVNGLYEKDEDAAYTDFYVSSFYHPDLTYELDLKDLSFKPKTSISVPYKPESLETRYVKYTSKDGTEIPMYITCLKKTKLNGKNPTLLYAYGGYGMTVEPAFDESQALWLLHGGVLAIPNIRGGGAEGSDWGLAGRRLNKQNGIDDFIAAGEYLISENYTSNEHLGGNGGSHGGLLVSAAAIQRPDLFKVVVAEAGAYDMLRFEKFTVGSAALNVNEFGTVSDLNDFNNLISYSPIHNIKEGVKYPNFLLMTGEGDDRVPPLHTYKFLATLQEKASPESLYLMYLVPGAGHGGPLNVNDWFDKMLYKYAFLYELLD